jgi:hypothetical protein
MFFLSAYHLRIHKLQIKTTIHILLDPQNNPLSNLETAFEPCWKTSSGCPLDAVSVGLACPSTSVAATVVLGLGLGVVKPPTEYIAPARPALVDDDVLELAAALLRGAEGKIDDAAVVVDGIGTGDATAVEGAATAPGNVSGPMKMVL